jgi:hypothetical protein
MKINNKCKNCKTLWDVNEQARDKYKTRKNTYKTFPEGTLVMVICASQDHHFFYKEIGEVTESTNGYLGVTIRFKKSRQFEDGTIQKGFSFNPNDLVSLEDITIYCKKCKHKLRTSTVYCQMGVKMLNKHYCQYREL